MTDIPEHIVERVARAICACHEPHDCVENEWPDYRQSAVEAIEALGGERVCISVDGEPAWLIPLGEEGEQ